MLAPRKRGGWNPGNLATRPKFTEGATRRISEIADGKLQSLAAMVVPNQVPDTRFWQQNTSFLPPSLKSMAMREFGAPALPAGPHRAHGVRAQAWRHVVPVRRIVRRSQEHLRKHGERLSDLQYKEHIESNPESIKYFKLLYLELLRE